MISHLFQPDCWWFVEKPQWLLFLFASKFWPGTTNGDLSFYKCRLSNGATQRRWGTQTLSTVIKLVWTFCTLRGNWNIFLLLSQRATWWKCHHLIFQFFFMMLVDNFLQCCELKRKDTKLMEPMLPSTTTHHENERAWVKPFTPCSFEADEIKPEVSLWTRDSIRFSLLHPAWCRLDSGSTFCRWADGIATQSSFNHPSLTMALRLRSRLDKTNAKAMSFLEDYFSCVCKMRKSRYSLPLVCGGFSATGTADGNFFLIAQFPRYNRRLTQIAVYESLRFWPFLLPGHLQHRPAVKSVHSF